MAEETLRDRAIAVVYAKVGALFQGDLGKEFSSEITDAVLAVVGDVVPAQPLRDLAAGLELDAALTQREYEAARTGSSERAELLGTICTYAACLKGLRRALGKA